ncbi:MAG: hypothetical protein EOO88_10075 [Pedobacter sp.]|nr:MAG: hypothetical protein EOO88_10075 [Pedobacter sp.]
MRPYVITLILLSAIAADLQARPNKITPSASPSRTTAQQLHMIKPSKLAGNIIRRGAGTQMKKQVKMKNLSWYFQQATQSNRSSNLQMSNRPIVAPPVLPDDAFNLKAAVTSGSSIGLRTASKSAAGTLLPNIPVEERSQAVPIQTGPSPSIVRNPGTVYPPLPEPLKDLPRNEPSTDPTRKVSTSSESDPGIEAIMQDMEKQKTKSSSVDEKAIVKARPSIASKKDDEQQGGSNEGQISITPASGLPKRAINVGREVPSVVHIYMAPASAKWGGDEVEIVISPVFDIVIEMPEAIEAVTPSSKSLTATEIKSNPRKMRLHLDAVKVQTPISMHVIDISKNLYTFTIIGAPADFNWEYVKTIMVNKRRMTVPELGSGDEASFLNGLDVSDAVQMVVGDVRRTDEYKLDLISARYNPGYIQYNFRLTWRDQSDLRKILLEKISTTLWANDLRLDGGADSSRDIHWIRSVQLSEVETKLFGRPVARLSVQVRASVLDIEEWKSAFVTLSDSNGYTKADFAPFIRDFRMPAGGGTHEFMNDLEGQE